MTYVRALLTFSSCLAFALAGESYSQNAICHQNHCINPLFPGLNDLPRLEQIVWQCTDHHTVSPYFEFCKGAVLYNPALPSPNSTSQAVSTLVKAQDDAAATMFFYHMSGLGYEAWDHAHPSKDKDECVRSVWKMVCYTYFPKVEAGCVAGQATRYLRPCSCSCEKYLETCGVECCDESPRCVFQHTADHGSALPQTGYFESAGASAFCTGSGAARTTGAPPYLLMLGLAALPLAAGGLFGHEAPQAAPAGRSRGLNLALSSAVAASALMLQGCDMNVPIHKVGNWRVKTDYLVKFEFLPPGQPPTSAQLNSCMASGVPATSQCSGRGYCREWNPDTVHANPVSFCVCDRDYADPECRTQRKSQWVAWLCTLFGGPLGIDYFYLGFPLWGTVKLLTLGGVGIWWIVDIIRIGSTPIYASDFRVANDLPLSVFILVTIFIFGALGFLIFLETYLSYRKKKREEMMKMWESEEARRLNRPDEMEGPRYMFPGGPKSFEGSRGDFSGYGATLPVPHPNAGAPRVEGFPPGWMEPMPLGRPAYMPGM